MEVDLCQDLALAKDLGNGQSTFLLYDKWIQAQSDTLINHLPDTQWPAHLLNLKVSDMICND